MCQSATGTVSALSDEESSERISNLLNNAVEKEIYPPIVHYGAGKLMKR